MSLSIVDRSGFLSDDLHLLTERRLLFALSRFGSKVQRVSVVFSDTNGHRGGVDKACCITVKLRRAADVIITDEDADVAACIMRSVARVGRAVARTIERTQELDRTGRPVWVEG